MSITCNDVLNEVTIENQDPEEVVEQQRYKFRQTSTKV